MVIPAYNEAGQIETVIRAATDAGLHVIVVDDGSTDGTAEIAIRAGAAGVIRHERNRGYEAALATGLIAASRCAGCRWVVTIDGDGQINPDEVKPLVTDAVGAGVALGCGVRSWIPRASERLAARVVRCLAGVTDPLCGLKAYRVDVIHRFAAFAGRGVGMAMTLRAIRSGERIAERVVKLVPRSNGASRYGGGWRGEIKVLGGLVSVLPIALAAAILANTKE